MKYARIDRKRLEEYIKTLSHNAEQGKNSTRGMIGKAIEGQKAKVLNMILSCLEPPMESETSIDGKVFRFKLTDSDDWVMVDDEDAEKVMEYTWWLGKSGNGKIKYAKRSIGGKSEGLHRVIMGLDIDDERMVDHINDDGLDNRKENLRICTKAENTRNLRSYGRTSDYKGVSWHEKRQKWQATIAKEGKQKWLGYFDDEKEAAREYDAMAREWFGDFARLNFETKECEQPTMKSCTGTEYHMEHCSGFCKEIKIDTPKECEQEGCNNPPFTRFHCKEHMVNVVNWDTPKECKDSCLHHVKGKTHYHNDGCGCPKHNDTPKDDES